MKNIIYINNIEWVVAEPDWLPTPPEEQKISTLILTWNEDTAIKLADKFLKSKIWDTSTWPKIHLDLGGLNDQYEPPEPISAGEVFGVVGIIVVAVAVCVAPVLLLFAAGFAQGFTEGMCS